MLHYLMNNRYYISRFSIRITRSSNSYILILRSQSEKSRQIAFKLRKKFKRNKLNVYIYPKSIVKKITPANAETTIYNSAFIVYTANNCYEILVSTNSSRSLDVFMNRNCNHKLIVITNFERVQMITKYDCITRDNNSIYDAASTCLLEWWGVRQQ